MGLQVFDRKKYAEIARQVAAEGCVLLRNEKKALPFREKDKVAVFGRCAFHYYKSGLGSGGLVNTNYVVSILDALRKCGKITLNERLLQIYEEWQKENPADEGNGWGTVPWSQKEMPLTEEMTEIAAKSDVAVVIIGRTAGEDQDNKNEAGSYLLTETEKDMIAKVSRACERTVVLLNVGNIIDMKWVEEYRPAAVLYVWQGGQEGGNGVLDVLTGAVNPCGKLADTIAYDIADYPSTKNFGGTEKNFYQEDIYVGYRYFETAAKDKVQYPFGYGLSYTQFEIKGNLGEIGEEEVFVEVRVKNTGNCAGKEVVQVYVRQPQGKLGKPERVLAGFKKTKELAPGESVQLFVRCPKWYFAAYDDSGCTGKKSAFLLEEGTYEIFTGSDVRTAKYSGSWTQKLQIIEVLEEAAAPIRGFKRFVRKDREDGTVEIQLEESPLRQTDSTKRLGERCRREIPYTGDKGYRLGDVFDRKVALEDFMAQLSDEDLMCMFRGEGMCSPKVTPGTAGAFGGVTENLRKFGIPVACCADGPSGIRMDCGTKAFSLPNGAAIGSTFDTELVKELFRMVGLELRKNKVDTLLGPGINIHRNPLNGRNFEYFSEDPLLTGKLCAAELEGMQESDVTGTIKHFCGNNQEQNRTLVDAVVSERALREIYLKCFEIAVKEGKARSVMTSYNPVNGIWAAGNYDLCTVILREEWKYQGIVMTDWWASANWEGEAAEKTNRAPMVLAQNDIYMCCSDAQEEAEKDNLRENFAQGRITRGDLLRNAENILRFLLISPAMLQELGRAEELQIEGNEEENDTEELLTEIKKCVAEENGEVLMETEAVTEKSGGSRAFEIRFAAEGEYRIEFLVSSKLDALAQLPVSLYVDNIYRTTLSFQGTKGEARKVSFSVGNVVGNVHYFKLVFGADGLILEQIKLVPVRE